MRLRLVERTGWLTRREFMESYSLSQLSPGIHLVALAGLIGHRLAGASGVGVSVAGMMVPAAIITVALSAVLSGISGQDRKSTRLNSSHGYISYAVFCLKKKKRKIP